MVTDDKASAYAGIPSILFLKETMPFHGISLVIVAPRKRISTTFFHKQLLYTELLPRRRSFDDICSCDKFRPESFKVKKRTYYHLHRCPCFTRRRFEISKYYKDFKKGKNLYYRRQFRRTDSAVDIYSIFKGLNTSINYITVKSPIN